MATPKMKTIQIRFTEDQLLFLQEEDVDLSMLVKQLLTQHFAKQNRLFPPSATRGIRNGAKPKGYENHKMNLLMEILSILNPHLPMQLGQAHNTIYAHLMEMIQDIVSDDLSTPLYGVAYEARQLLKTEGFIKLMAWFGIVTHIQPITDLSQITDEDGDTIDPVIDMVIGFGVKSADDD